MSDTVKAIFRLLGILQRGLLSNLPKQSLEPGLKLLEGVVANSLKQVDVLKNKANTLDVDVSKCFGKDWDQLNKLTASYTNNVRGCVTRVTNSEKTKTNQLTTRGTKLFADAQNVLTTIQRCLGGKDAVECSFAAALNIATKSPILIGQAFSYVLAWSSTYVSLRSAGATCLLSKTSEAFTKAVKQTENIAGCLIKAVDKNIK